MELQKIVIIALVAFASSISIQAITLKEFIAKCDTICNVTPIKLTSDMMPKLKEKKVEEIVLFKVDSITNDTKQTVIDNVKTITKTEDMLAIKHNEDDTAVQVFIQPRGENMEMLVTVFDDQDSVIVYLVGSAEILQHENLVNIGGKDLIKEALKGQTQELKE